MTTGMMKKQINALLEIKSLEGLCDVKAVEAYKKASCNNDVCEIGEFETCSGKSPDCGVNIQICDKTEGMFGQSVMCNGHGTCSIAESKECHCFVGYEGPNCETCSFGFFQVGEDNRCIVGQAFMERPIPEVFVESTNKTETEVDKRSVEM